MIQQYKKKPVVIEAVEYTGKNGFEIETWSQRAVIESPVLEPNEFNTTGEYLQIQTLEGVMTADVGDYIIKGVKGEFYPCKPDIFKLTYELINKKEKEHVSPYAWGQPLCHHNQLMEMGH